MFFKYRNCCHLLGLELLLHRLLMTCIINQYKGIDLRIQDVIV
jgi:hypothetical protein